MLKSLSPEALARASSRRPWTTVGLWILAIVVAGFVASALLSDALSTDVDFTNAPEAKRAAELVEQRLRPEEPTEILIVGSESSTVDDPAFEEFVGSLTAEAARLGPSVVKGAVNYYTTEDESLVSRDRRTTLIPITLAGDDDDAAVNAPKFLELAESNDAPGRFEVFVFGAATLGEDFNVIAEEDLRKGEAVGIGVALVVLVVVFGAVVAALLPIAMALVAIALAMGTVAVVGQVFDFSFFVTNMITMMGLAVGIDYSLFIVSRYREERSRGYEKLEAIRATGATASRAVFFSGVTVVLALMGMLIIPTTIFRSLASGAIFVVIAAMLASLTLLPAILGLMGDRINALRVFRRRPSITNPARTGFWDRVTRGVMKRPVAGIIIVAGLLILAAVPYLDIKTGFAGVSTMPDDIHSKQAFAVLSQEFSGGLSSPVEVVVDGDTSSAAIRDGIERIQTDLSSDGSFGPSQVEVNEAGDLAVISAPVLGDPSGQAAVDSIARLRESYVPEAFAGSGADVMVGGETAFSKDFFDLTDTYMPIVFTFVLGLSFMLLTVVFRSIVVPIKAIIMNLLSVGAAYGLVVLVCQKGVGAELLGFQQVEAIEAWLPLFLFSVLFGLSMDYHVFLLTRIREHFDKTRDNGESVAYGLRTTGGIITGAALIMVAVFGGFAAGQLVAFQQMGFGLAVAVLIDATLVRSVLVPASMKLLGDRNWYLPGWLQWLPELHVEGAEPSRTVTVPADVAERAGEREKVPAPD